MKLLPQSYRVEKYRPGDNHLTKPMALRLDPESPFLPSAPLLVDLNIMTTQRIKSSTENIRKC
jgi:hypothetical protein